MTGMVLTSFTIQTAFASFGDLSLSQGSKGPDVKVLQQKLNSLGYWCETDGIFGSWTEKKVLEFQADYGIKQTGVIGKISLQKLKELTQPQGTVDGENIINTAERYMGVPYVWGGESPAGFDCSGYTQYVMKQNGISIPRTAAEQFAAGISIARGSLKMGDLVFFTTYKPGASHVGFYIGNNQFIHASSAGGEVTISSLETEFYSSHYIGARRYRP